MACETILEFQHITKMFPGVRALDDVSFSVRRGEVHVLLGENGAGKSTIIKILTGVHRADSGVILFNGKPIQPNGIMESRELGIGTVFQENSLVPHLSVAENIFLTREIRNKMGLIDWESMYAQCSEWTHRLGVDLDPKKRVGDYSVAQQQIVEIVKIFSQNPHLVILDEPTSALSDAEIDVLFRMIRKMQESGVTFIFISHRMEELKKIGNSGTILRDGKCVGHIPEISSIELERVIQMMVGRSLSQQFPKREVEIGEIRLQVKNLTVPKTIYDVNFSVRCGEVLGLAGLVGSGRTSVAKAIIGALHKTSGEIRIDGTAVKIRSPQDAIHYKIGYLPEDRKAEGLFLKKDILENTTIASMNKYKKGLLLQRKKQIFDVNDLVNKLQIKAPSIYREVRFLSGGNQQKVVFSKWLCAESNIYIFDEPTRGIDVAAKTEIYKIINDLAAQGVAIVVISSELPEIIGMCDRAIVMYEGRITGEVQGNQLNQETIMHYAIGGNHHAKK